MTEFENRPADWLSVGEALGRVLARVEPLDEEMVSIPGSLGRVLAGGIRARASLPPWDNSAMDGYAVRHQDLRGASKDRPVILQVVGETRAGEVAGRALGKGESVRIMTGAPIPPGADAVVRVEDSDREASPGRVKVFVETGPGKDIRQGGQDMRAGEEILSPGVPVGAGQMGLLAASGASRVPVHRKPLIATLSNGDELAAAKDFQQVMEGASIPETNSPSLAAAVELAGGIPFPLGIARDTRESILEKVEEAREGGADVLVTSGGASMGERDLFKRVLEDHGFHLDFWRVKMRPGTPFSFGTLLSRDGRGPMPVFGLPGNPASSFVTFQILCRPFILRLAGHRQIHRRVIPAVAGEPFQSPLHLTHFFRIVLKGGPPFPEALLTGPQTSGLVSGQGHAHGLAVVPEGQSEIRKGEEVRVILLDDFGIGGDGPGYLPG